MSLFDEEIIPPSEIPFILKQSQIIARSYEHWTGRSLCPVSDPNDDEVLAKALFEAPFVLASADNAEDPILNYGNRTALILWEMDWPSFTQTPGRKTAEPMERAQREEFLKTVEKNGFIDHYSGIRISSKGRRFKIERATVWNLLDENGKYCGQAATFNQWQYL